MSKSIKTLANDFKNTGVLEIEIKTLKTRCDQLEAYNNHLLAELDRARKVDRSGVIKLYLTPEQEILEQQISRIQAVSRERTLTLEETKMLDLHIKNKRLLDDKSTVNAEYKDIKNSSISDLLKLAEGEPSDVTKNAESKTSAKAAME
jgi:hypothetical protein